VACLALGVGALSGCSQPVHCSGGNYRGGCVAGTEVPSSVSPSYVSPAYAAPAAAPASARPASIPLGDPSTFADVDDKQCRSYGLTFGSRDYADCRIRLSAQHRGLDPNIGATPGSGSR
jgi:hypothetical protein